MNIKIKDIKYPQYYEVNDIPVILELEGEEVVGKSANGMPYPIGKIFVTGYKITREEYVKMAKKLYGKKF